MIFCILCKNLNNRSFLWLEIFLKNARRGEAKELLSRWGGKNSDEKHNERREIKTLCSM